MCVQERAPLENIKNGAIWHIWSTYAKFSLTISFKNIDVVDPLLPDYWGESASVKNIDHV